MVGLGVAGSWYGVTFLFWKGVAAHGLVLIPGVLNRSSLSVVSPSPCELLVRWDCGSRAVF